MNSEGSKGFVLGYAMFAVTGLAWLAIALGTGSSRWVMQPRNGIVLAMIIQFLGAVLFAASTRPGFLGLSGLEGGVALGITAILFLIGPGNIWPIVIGVDLMFLVPTVAVGFGLGVLLGRALPAGWIHGQSHTRHLA